MAIFDYRVATGHDKAYFELAAISPEPKGGIVTPVERAFGVSGAIHEAAHYVEFYWEFIETPTDYQLLLSQFGLMVADSAEVSLFAPSPRLVSTLYNGIALYPEYGQDVRWTNFFLRDVVIRVVDLRAQT